MTTLSSSAIRKWSEAGLFRQVDLGLSVEDANRLAQRCWIAILSGRSPSSVLGDFENLPDVLHALGRLLQDSTAPASRDFLVATASLYQFTSGQLRSFPSTDEKHVLSAVFAYVAWRCCRRLALWPEARRWESSCERHVIARDDAAEYLHLRPAERGRLSPKFLWDPATLLVACRRFRREVNQDPVQSLHFAIVVYRWVTSGWHTAPDEDRFFFAGELALSAASALRISGRFVECRSWIQASARWFEKTVNPIPSLARVEQAIAASLYNHLEAKEALALLPRLLQIFSTFHMEDELQKCQYLEALILKDVGRVDEAIVSLENLVRSESTQEDPLLFGLTLSHLGDAQARRGRAVDSISSFARAIPELEKAGVPWAVADCKAIMAEVLRDQGNLDNAVPLYEAAVQMSLAMRLEGRAAYLRVLLAEALIMAGREEDAVEEIVTALPVLNREALGTATRVAVTLLQESIRRQKADPDAVRRLRIELQKTSERTNQ